MLVRQGSRGRALVIAGIFVAALSACGGGGSKPSTFPSTTPDEASTTTSAGGGGTGKCFTDPGTQKARVRFVNLFTNATYPSGDIDIWQGFGPDDGCGKKLTTVPYGTASDYIDVTASDESGNWNAVAYVGGSAKDDDQIISQGETWKGGEQVTFIFTAGEGQSNLPPAAGSDQAFFETSEPGDESTLTTVSGKAVVAIGASSLQYLLKDQAWVTGIDGQTGCLQAVGDTENSRTNVGGTSLVVYPVDPGSLSLGLYPSQPGDCTGTPTSARRRSTPPRARARSSSCTARTPTTSSCWSFPSSESWPTSGACADHVLLRRHDVSAQGCGRRRAEGRAA